MTRPTSKFDSRPATSISPTAKSALVPCRYTPGLYTSKGTGSRLSLTMAKLPINDAVEMLDASVLDRSLLVSAFGGQSPRQTAWCEVGELGVQPHTAWVGRFSSF